MSTGPAPMSAPSISKAQAKRYALLATVAAATLAIVADLQRGNVPDPRIVLGAVIAAVILTIGAELAPAVAGALAIVLLLTALLVTGADVWRWVANLMSGPRPSSTSSTSSTDIAGAARNYAAGQANPGRGGPANTGGLGMIPWFQPAPSAPAPGSGAGGGGGGSW